eukprot:Nk52_evm16s156 gene=Nk52_evmTU16s156
MDEELGQPNKTQVVALNEVEQGAKEEVNGIHNGASRESGAIVPYEELGGDNSDGLSTRPVTFKKQTGPRKISGRTLALERIRRSKKVDVDLLKSRLALPAMSDIRTLKKKKKELIPIVPEQSREIMVIDPEPETSGELVPVDEGARDSEMQLLVGEQNEDQERGNWDIVQTTIYPERYALQVYSDQSSTVTDSDFFGMEHPLWKTEPESLEAEKPPISKKDITDPEEYINLFFDDESNSEFVYMCRTNADPNPTHFNPYSLRIIPYSEVDMNDYYTLSQKGVSNFLNGVPDFTPLSQWLREKEIFTKIMKMGLFNNFKMDKTYRAWKYYVHYKKMGQSQRCLEKELFLLIAPFRVGLMKISDICFEIANVNSFNIDQSKSYTLAEFASEQTENISSVAAQLKALSASIKVIIEGTCTSLLQKFENAYAQAKPPNKKNAQGKVEKKVKRATYTEQAERRSLYQKLANFIKRCDMMVVHALHQCVVNSIYQLSLNLKELVKEEPQSDSSDESKCMIEGGKDETSDQFKDVYNERFGCESSVDTQAIMMKAEAALLKENEEKRPPMFLIDLLFDSNDMQFNPSLKDATTMITQLVIDSLNSTFILKSFETEESLAYIREFCVVDSQSGAGDGGQENTSGTSLEKIVSDDQTYRDLLEDVCKSLEISYATAERQTHKFTPFKQMLNENLMLNMEEIKESEPDIEFFHDSLAMYHAQIDATNGIEEEIDVGLIMIRSDTLKETFLPSPQGCLEKIESYLPELSAKRNEDLLSVINSSSKQLSTKPGTVEEFVESLHFLEQLNSQIATITEKFNLVTRLYSLMDEYKIKAAPEEIALYQTLVPSFSQLKASIAYCEARKEDRITHYTTELEASINKLKEKISLLKGKIEDPRFMDINSYAVDSIAGLNHFRISLENISKESVTLAKYQVHFELPITTYPELNEAFESLECRELLWQSVLEWDDRVSSWQHYSLSDIDFQSMEKEIKRFYSVCDDLSVSLPNTEVSEQLRQKIEEFHDGLPVVAALADKLLKSRHWDQIQEMCGEYLVRDDRLNIGFLMDRNIFSYKEYICLVQENAMNENNLENMIKKIEVTWHKEEFHLAAHREIKDMYIIVDTDDVWVLVEESQVMLSSLKGSRYLQPYRAQVVELDETLTFFSETFEQLLLCQKNWLYLENIFSAPDIQRQLVNESRLFSTVDKSFKEIMRKTADIPNCIRALQSPGVKDALSLNNSHMDTVLKCLEDYLEMKRMAFPRLYFLSNDELLAILAQTKNPHAVQPHLSKCFASINSLKFGSSENIAIDILAMVSREGEIVPLTKNLKARGSIEAWLSATATSMAHSIRKLIKTCLMDYSKKELSEWIKSHFGQGILTVAHIVWTHDVSVALESTDVKANLQVLLSKKIDQLTVCADLVRENLKAATRLTQEAFITTEVHYRDIIHSLFEAEIDDADDLEWTKQLRMYWDVDEDSCVLRQFHNPYAYGYEYMGCSPRLVMTPLTDRCFLTLTSAMSFHLGGSPSGPAGTGKTETVKDLAKIFAKHCVVFNCSEGVDFRMMGKFLCGLVQAGSWACFDEFNRIDLEVLSVIAQQIRSIKFAKDEVVSKFIFEGHEVKLNPSCAIFTTLNPGYKGRVELPDNLKALFRPIAMMIPDYAMIAEIMLLSQGFHDAKALAWKITALYRLCSEQLSPQGHYDFGMRAIKSVLKMAGEAKRERPDEDESLALMQVLKDSNLPRFVGEDAALFDGVLTDLFPKTVLPYKRDEKFEEILSECIKEQGLRSNDITIVRTTDLKETLKVRHGVCIIGPAGEGKSTILKTLQLTLNKWFEQENELKKEDLIKKREQLRRDSFEKADFELTLEEQELYNKERPRILTHYLNPKCLTLKELYGFTHPETLEWVDGVLPKLVRDFLDSQYNGEKWIVCDGPIDAGWIENMNTVLDDNKLLCLPSGERMGLGNDIKMLFEVEDVKSASPATVSRLGMVYVSQDEGVWETIIYTWLDNDTCLEVLKEWNSYILHLVEETFPETIAGVLQMKTYLPLSVESVVRTFCTIFSHIIKKQKLLELSEDISAIKGFLTRVLLFSLIWSFGGCLSETEKDQFDALIRNLIETKLNIAKLPPEYTVFHYYLDFDNGNFYSWDIMKPKRGKYEKAEELTIVPTIDTISTTFMLNLYLEENQPCFLVGPTGVGKSCIAKSVLKEKQTVNSETFHWFSLQLSVQSSCAMVQKTMEKKMTKKSKGALSGPGGKMVSFFVDDVNMPMPEASGAQPVIELFRQILDHKGFYNRAKFYWSAIDNLTLLTAGGPPGGGRNDVTLRFSRHFNTLAIHEPSVQTLESIFKTILGEGLEAQKFPSSVTSLTNAVVGGSVAFYNSLREQLLPTPSRPLYTFNMRDLRKVFEGILQADSSGIAGKEHILKLTFHETCRVYHDRLNSDKDRELFFEIFSEYAHGFLNWTLSSGSFRELSSICFGDFYSTPGMNSNNGYILLPDIAEIEHTLKNKLVSYNNENTLTLEVIFFKDAVLHVCRILRILRQDNGHGLLVGVGGGGKRTLVKLCAFIYDLEVKMLEIKKNYDQSTFHEDLREVLKQTGVKGIPTVFLITEQELVNEGFLESISCLLNNGEVPNLFEGDEYEILLNELRPFVHAEQGSEDRDDMYAFFLARTRSFLHIVLCLSPFEEKFRKRLREYPGLITCCNIDYFDSWPAEAMHKVANHTVSGLVSYCHSSGLQLSEDDIAALDQSLVNTQILLQETSELFMQESKRKFYVTPASFLDFLHTYGNIFRLKGGQLITKRNTLQSGLDKLEETNILVAKMQKELTSLGPQLQQTAEDTEKLLVSLADDQQKADKVKELVSAEEEIVLQQTQECEAIAKEAQDDLDMALPAFNAAMEALDSLDKSDIAEIRVFNKPPEMVMIVMEAVCVLLGVKTDWASAKQLLGDPGFLKSLVNYDKDNIPDFVIKKLNKYTSNPNFTPEIVSRTSVACRSMCMWVLALVMYAQCYRVVQPKRVKLQESHDKLEGMRQKLLEKRELLSKAEQEVYSVQLTYKQSLDEKMKLEDNILETSQKLARAEKLTLALAEEHDRWTESILTLNSQLEMITGDILLSAVFVSYMGPFTSSYRKTVLDRCRAMSSLRFSENFSFIDSLGVPKEILEWNFQGLPKDSHSVENSIIAKYSDRWPLIVDPQEQARKWILNKQGSGEIKVVEQSSKYYIRAIEACIQNGNTVLFEMDNPAIDGSLMPLILRQFVESMGSKSIKIGETFVTYDPQFRFYMLLKQSNPKFSPETCSRVNILNFLVTKEGLEDQLLNEVVTCEQPSLEKEKNDLIHSVSADKETLENIEETILSLLHSSKTSFLDDEVLIKALKTSKEQSAQVKMRVQDSVATEKSLYEARSVYLPVAKRGTDLFFTLASLEKLHYFYQYSLKYFTNIFSSCILGTEKGNDTKLHLAHLCNIITSTVFNSVSKGLFEQHKLVFAFLLSCNIMMSEGLISLGEWNYFLNGKVSLLSRNAKPKPESLKWMPDKAWRTLEDVVDICPELAVFYEEVHLHSGFLGALYSSDTPNIFKLRNRPPELSHFNVLLLAQIVNKKNFVLHVTHFVEESLGHEYAATHPLNLKSVYGDSSSREPLLFILSPATDPAEYLMALAKDMNITDTLHMMSLGQGQGHVAEAVIRNAQIFGQWVFLQNCHLLPSWMAALSDIVKNMNTNEESDISNDDVENSNSDDQSDSIGNDDIVDSSSRKNSTNEKGKVRIHSEFRLWLSSMPTMALPKALLENSTKLTIEPPKGLQANITNSFREISEKRFEEFGHHAWKKLVFSLCFFNAILHERKKFGPMGWTKSYDFSSSDFHVALQTLAEVLSQSYDIIHWKALKYLTGDIIYGGRVTDNWDRRILHSVLEKFFNTNVLTDNYSFLSEIEKKKSTEDPHVEHFRSIYSVPAQQTYVSYLNHIHHFPLVDSPLVFGLDESANTIFELRRYDAFLEAARTTSNVTFVSQNAGSSGENSVSVIAKELSTNLPQLIALSDCNKSLFKSLEVIKKRRMSLGGYLERKGSGSLHSQNDKPMNPAVVQMNCLSVFLKQEVLRFNNLITVIQSSLENIDLAMKGQLLMTEEMEQVSKSLQENRVPALWRKHSYESLYGLGMWFADFKKRVEFIRKWVKQGYPYSYWISAFFFPNGFLTSVMQNFSRQHSIPVNSLTFKFNVQEYFVENADKVIVNDSETTLVHGMFLESAKWNFEYRAITVTDPSEMVSPLPLLGLMPKSNFQAPSTYYNCPLYKTAARAGELDSAGHSTNFIIGIPLKTAHGSADFWIRRGVALLAQLDS